jgi:hypothetical protein
MAFGGWEGFLGTNFRQEMGALLQKTLSFFDKHEQKFWKENLVFPAYTLDNNRMMIVFGRVS